MCRPPTRRSCPAAPAYLTDAGMTGDYDSVIGMDKEEPLRRFMRKTPGARYEPANGEATSAAWRSRSAPTAWRR